MTDEMNMGNNLLQAFFTEESFELKKTNTSGLSSIEARLYELFSKNKGEFFLELAFAKIGDLSAAVSFLKYISQEYVKAVFNDPNFNLLEAPVEINLPNPVIENIAKNVPYVIGSQYVDPTWVRTQVGLLNRAYISTCTSSGDSPRVFFARRSHDMVVPSRIYFHLVENKQRDRFPFAFLATYTVLINGTATHAPLKNALSEMRDKKDLRALIKH